MLALLAASAVQYLGFRRFLGGRLHSPDPVLRRAALVSWARFAIAWQLAVIALTVAWIVPALLHHTRGFAWAAPPVGLLVGTGLPLQLVVMAISRSAARP